MSPRHTTFALASVGLLSLSLAAQDAEKKDLHGDPLPKGAIARMGTSRLRNETPITGFAFSPDGQTLACGGSDGKVTTWDAGSGKVAKRVALAGANQITGMQFSKDAKTLAVAVLGTESGIRILDVATLAQSKSLVDPTRKGFYRYSVQLSPDGKTALAHESGSQTLLVWDVAEGEVKHRIPKVGDYNGAALAFLPDGKHFVAPWTDRKLHLVSVADGKSVRDLESAQALAGSGRVNNSVTALALTPDGKRLYSRRHNERVLHVVEVNTGKLVRSWDNASFGYNAGKMSVSHDGRFLVESASNFVRVWGLASGKVLREFETGNYNAAFAVSSDGKRLAIQATSHLSVIDLASGKSLHGDGGHQNAPHQLAFTRDGKRLVSFGSSSLRIWDAATGKEEQRVRQYGYGVAHLTAGDTEAKWIQSDRSLYRFEFGAREATRLTSPRQTTGSYSSVVVSPDGKSAAAIDTRNRKLALLSLEDAKKDRELANLPQNFYATPLTFSPDSRYLAMSSYLDRSVTLFDLIAGVELRKLLPGQDNRVLGPPSVAFAPDGRSLLQFDGETRVVETSSGGERARLPREQFTAAPRLMWSPDGRLAVRAYPDGLVTAHDVVNAKEVFRASTGQGTITALAMSLDGRRLATGGSNTTILVWDVPAPAKLSSALAEKDAWRDLESPDAAKGFAAILYFVANPDEAVKTFAEKIKTQGAPDLKRIDKLIKDLDDDAFAVREKASEELAEIGAPALEKLEAALKDPPSLEVKRRCDVLVRKLKGGTSVAPDRLRAVRAVEALERVGTPAAKKTLQHLRKQKMAPDVESAIDGALRRLGGS